ncbi:CAAX geranylgeranyltransferase alpha subunit [Saxophila tyrrhenica]|uniref:Protein farnesyltransferase/geranylgeranyltransferase type-1 subunit alpha n=1 Tax=Saxophila tyrrhenica TaxID=1690608 RepID=A0AAV9PL55_9PEZI|nr:CAAX geranylgeranyltransferase alpha subunit [Saxophila tyrrhenica]
MGNIDFTSPLWADLTPLPTDEGGDHPLAAIAYTEEYATTMSYLRAVMALSEHSPRVLLLTAELIDMNPAHYTVWLYRAETLFALSADLHEELEWLNETALDHQKNYQIWHHRMLIVDRLGESEGEAEFVEQMFERDAKNYHVWSYRQWMVKRFGLWEKGELEFTEGLIRRDVRNNSAWNHRWFVVNGREGEGVEGVEGVKGDEGVREREVGFAKREIGRAPQNLCGWSYLRGVVRKGGMRLGELKEFAGQFAGLDGGEVRSSHALDLMAEILAEEEGGRERAGEALDMLMETYDPVRRNYWEYRKGMLGLPSAAA